MRNLSFVYTPSRHIAIHIKKLTYWEDKIQPAPQPTRKAQCRINAFGNNSPKVNTEEMSFKKNLANVKCLPNIERKKLIPF